MQKITWEDVKQTPIARLSPAYKSNGFVFTSGCIGADPLTGIIISDIERQTILAIENLKTVLTVSGSSIDKAVKVLLFITDANNLDIVNKVYSRYFVHEPARSCVIVQFGNKDIKVELECIAECEQS